MLEPEIAESLTNDDISVYAKRIPKKKSEEWLMVEFKIPLYS